MNKVSIILPVYNTSKFLDKLFASLKEQTYENMEFIFVNDGSPDDSGEKIEAFKKVDDRVVHVKTKNQGLAQARNTGIEYVTGEYLVFVDSDDYLPKNAIEKMVKAMDGEAVSLVVGTYERIYDDIKESNMQKKHPFQRMDIKNSGKTVFEAPELMRTIYHAAWGKMYHSSFFTNNPTLRFYPGIWYEDLEFFLRALPKLGEIVILEDKVYNYIVRKGSIMTTNGTKIFDIFTVFEHIINELTLEGTYKKFQEEIEFIAIYHGLIGTSYRILTTKGMPKWKNLKRTMDFMKTKFPNYRKNKYLKEESLFYRTFVNVCYLLGRKK